MKYHIGTMLILIGFGFTNQMQPLDMYDIIGALIMVMGFSLTK